MSTSYKLLPLKLDYDVFEVQKRFSKLYTGLVYDACEHLGLKGRAMDSGIYPLVHTMQVAGPAFTVHCIATPSRDANTHDIRLGMLKSMTPGVIQIRDTQNCRSCGQFGEIAATAAKAAGCAGAVIDGSTRDSNYLIDMGFPTFCRFRNPVEPLAASWRSTIRFRSTWPGSTASWRSTRATTSSATTTAW